MPIKWYLEILTLTQNLSFAARFSSIDGFDDVIREFTISSFARTVNRHLPINTLNFKT